MFGSYFVGAVSENLSRANEAIATGDYVAATQAVSQAMAVTAAGIAAGLYASATKYPLEGLSIVLNSLSKNPGVWANILRAMGLDPLDASRVQAIIKTYGAAEYTAAGINYAINWTNQRAVGVKIYDWIHPDPLISQYWRQAITPTPRDPLAIDLDGDGIETLAVGTAPVLFDHDANGIKTGTGWLKGDDAWLVLDRNGNGAIDSGRKLFGVDTLVTDSDGKVRNATSGFDALKSADSNGDGIFNSSDAAFADVRLWQDLNSDGVSQTDELVSLADKGIVSMS